MDQAPKRQPSVPMGLFISVFTIVFTLVFGWTAISTALTPKSYSGWTRLEVGTKAGITATAASSSLAATQRELISSGLILQKVIAGLRLNEAWGKKYFDGETLKSWETLTIFKARIDVRLVPGTSILDICVYDDNPNDAAALANAIANAYVGYVTTNSDNVAVQIIDRAAAINAPVKPNVASNLFIGSMIAVLIASLLAAAATFFVYWKACHEPRLENDSVLPLQGG